MSSVPVIASGLAGGVGLFLLGMWLMTDGLKPAAGPALGRLAPARPGEMQRRYRALQAALTLGIKPFSCASRLNA